MGHANARQSAVASVTAWKSNGSRVPARENGIGEEFGVNVFSDKVMQEKLPDKVYKALRETIKKGAPLDPSVADAVADAMKEWAIDKGATHYTHWFQPMTGLTAEKHDSFLVADRRGHGHRRVQRQGAGPRRARRVELPLRRHPRHLRGPRLHRLGPDQPRLHPREPQRHHALHPDGLLLLDRRGARQEDPAAPLDAGALEAGRARPEALRLQRQATSAPPPAPSRNTS